MADCTVFSSVSDGVGSSVRTWHRRTGENPGRSRVSAIHLRGKFPHNCAEVMTVDDENLISTRTSVAPIVVSAAYLASRAENESC
jgi:hypothetical protein